jgi:hypothetical protein
MAPCAVALTAMVPAPAPTDSQLRYVQIGSPDLNISFGFTNRCIHRQHFPVFCRQHFPILQATFSCCFSATRIVASLGHTPVSTDLSPPAD